MLWMGKGNKTTFKVILALFSKLQKQTFTKSATCICTDFPHAWVQL